LSSGRGRRALAVAGRLAVSVTLLWLVSRYVDVDEVLARLAGLSLGWVALGLAVSVLQVGVLAWRWRFTAARLGIDLPLREALSEYYLGILLNQVLPGGVTGDVSRAWRHARTEAPTGPSVRAVILERVSAQVVMTLAAVVSVLMLPWASGAVRLTVAFVTTSVLMLVLARVARVAMGARRMRSDSRMGRIWADVHQALLTREAFAAQLASAILVVASYIVVFLVAARAVGMETSIQAMLPLVAPVLMTMLIPVTVAGWGIREAAAAALWGVAGLTPDDGAAVAVTYGLLVLVSSAPGLIVLMRDLIAGRGRRARPPRA
jgi:uncharacterized membrane protein YbhN (UPF0104 family)